MVDIYSIRLLSKYYREFIDTNFMLESYDYPLVIGKIIKKHGKYLKKIITYDYNNILCDEYIADCIKLEILSTSGGSSITDNG